MSQLIKPVWMFDAGARSIAARKAVRHCEGALTRVTSETDGSNAAFGLQRDQEKINAVVWGDGQFEFRLDAILVLIELGGASACDLLVKIANDAHFDGDEIRQAAIWGLGKTGLKAYDALCSFIDDPDDNVAMHAIAGFGKDTPEGVVQKLIAKLSSGPRRAAAASEALRLIGTETVIAALARAAPFFNNWVLATLGRMPPALVRESLCGSPLFARVEPLLLLNADGNWLASADRVMDMAFLLRETEGESPCSDRAPAHRRHNE